MGLTWIRSRVREPVQNSLHADAFGSLIQVPAGRRLPTPADMQRVPPCAGPASNTRIP